MNQPIDRITLIKQRLRALCPTRLIVTDESAAHAEHAGYQSAGSHFSVEIVSEVFNQKSLPERHRLVYQALGELMQTDIHALRIRAKATNE